jgi:hypothetical protein
MRPNDFLLPFSAAEAIITDVARFGALGVETGGFLLAAREECEVAVVALAGTAGIARRSELFQVSEIALDRLFAFADRNELWIPAQFHSHRFGAFLSACDIDHGLAVDGFVTAVVPHFSAPPTDPGGWGWWRYDSQWLPVDPPRAALRAVSVVTFDADGVA